MAIQPTETIKTSFLIISDTHSAELFPSDDIEHAYRSPLPRADVLFHAGDLTNFGYINEYEAMAKMIAAADAELKIVIAGNHDVTLDVDYYELTGRKRFHRNISEDLDAVRDIWSGEEAKKAGIVYLEEGIRTFMLRNGAKFTVCVPSANTIVVSISEAEPGLTMCRFTRPLTSPSSVTGLFPTSAMRIASTIPMPRTLYLLGLALMSFSLMAHQWVSRIWYPRARL